VCETLLDCGIPMAKLDKPSFQRLLEDGQHALGGRTGVTDYEIERIFKAIEGKPVSVTFDCTARFAEVSGTTFRYIEEAKDEKNEIYSWKIKEICSDISILKQKLSGVEGGALLVDILFTKYRLKSRDIIGFHRDSASVNGVSLYTDLKCLEINDNVAQSLMNVCVNATDVRCICHVGDRVLKKSSDNLLILKQFSSKWTKSTNTSINFKHDWFGRTNEVLKRVSPVRWASRWLVNNQLHFQWKHVIPFLESTTACDTLVSQMRSIIKDHGKTLRLELRISRDFGVFLQMLFTTLKQKISYLWSNSNN